MSDDVTVYSKPDCPACNMTKMHLDKRGIAYAEHGIDQRPPNAYGIKSAPVVVAGGDMWGGYRPDRIDALAPPRIS